MALSYSFDQPGRVVTIRYESEPSLAEWTETMRAAMNDPRFGPGVKLLLDRSLLGAPSPEFVRGVTDFLSVHRRTLAEHPLALVVGSKGAYGMARMGQALLDLHGVAFEIFESLEAAREWLDRP
jgi:hypothetical protein